MTTLVETGSVAYPRIVTEKIDDVSIGRITIPVYPMRRWQPSEAFHRFFNALNGMGASTEGIQPHELRRRITFSLNNNTPNTDPIITHERPVSAYYTYNPNKEVVIIEWGAIDPARGEAKLHTYLNQMINYVERVKQGMKLSSGHVARVSATEEEIYLAWLDNLPTNSTHIPKEDPMGRLINTLHLSGFIPVAADGSVRLPAF